MFEHLKTSVATSLIPCHFYTFVCSARRNLSPWVLILWIKIHLQRTCANRVANLSSWRLYLPTFVSNPLKIKHPWSELNFAWNSCCHCFDTRPSSRNRPRAFPEGESRLLARSLSIAAFCGKQTNKYRRSSLTLFVRSAASDAATAPADKSLQRRLKFQSRHVDQDLFLAGQNGRSAQTFVASGLAGRIMRDSPFLNPLAGAERNNRRCKKWFFRQRKNSPSGRLGWRRRWRWFHPFCCSSCWWWWLFAGCNEGCVTTLEGCIFHPVHPHRALPCLRCIDPHRLIYHRLRIFSFIQHTHKTQSNCSQMVQILQRAL